MRLPVIRRRTQSGNVLFLILIAVALFAALSYAVTRSGRGSGSIDREQAGLIATQITSAGAVLKTSVTRMILSGTPATSIVCEPVANGTDCGPGSLNGRSDLCTTGTTCLFAPEGGSATVPSIPQNALDMAGVLADFPHAFEGPTSYQGFTIDGFNGGGEDTSISGLGTPAKEVVMQIFRLKQAICLSLNRGLGISGIPVGDGNWDPLIAAPGKEAACIDNDSNGQYTYYQVLVVN